MIDAKKSRQLRTEEEIAGLTDAMVRAQMIRMQTNILTVLVSALSVASIFMTHTLFTVVKNVQFETRVKEKEYSQPRFVFSVFGISTQWY